MVDTVQPFAIPVRCGQMCRSLISREGKLFASGHDDGQVVVFDNAGIQTAEFPTVTTQNREGGFFPWIWDMAFVGSDPSILVSNNVGRLGLWNARTGSLISDISLPLESPYDKIGNIAVSLDENFAAFSGCLASRIYCWDLRRSETTWRSPQFSDVIKSIRFIPESGHVLIVIGSFGNEYAVLDANDGRIIKHSVDHQSLILSSTDRSGQGVVVRNYERAGRVRFLNAETEAEISTLITDRLVDDLCQGVFSSDGRLFAALPDVGPAEIWDVDTGGLVARFDDGQNYFERACFTEDNRGLLAQTCGGGHEPTSLGLWSIANSRLERAFEVSEPPEKIVTGGEVLVSGGQGGTVEMFHIY